MPKIYQEETLKMIWEMINDQKMKLKDISEFLNVEMAKVNDMYKAAYRRFGCNQHSNRKIKPGPKKKIEAPPSLIRIERHKGIYSNKSPMGIASEMFYQ